MFYICLGIGTSNLVDLPNVVVFVVYIQPIVHYTCVYTSQDIHIKYEDNFFFYLDHSFLSKYKYL